MQNQNMEYVKWQRTWHKQRTNSGQRDFAYLQHFLPHGVCGTLRQGVSGVDTFLKNSNNSTPLENSFLYNIMLRHTFKLI